MKKTMHFFKIAEDSKKFDLVKIEYDEKKDIYIVSWKWTCMEMAFEEEFNSFDEAIKFYEERKHFATICN